MIVGVSQSCFKYLGLKSSFFNGNHLIDVNEKLGLEEISPILATELKDIEKVNKYLGLEEDDEFKVNISTEYLEEKFLAVRNEEDDLDQVKREYDKQTARMKESTLRKGKFS